MAALNYSLDTNSIFDRSVTEANAVHKKTLAAANLKLVSDRQEYLDGLPKDGKWRSINHKRFVPKVVDNKTKILSDPKYKTFALRYWNDPLRFAIEVCGLKLSSQQIDLLKAVADPGSFTSVSSGHGTGKSHITAAIVWWHLTVYPNSQVMITANNQEQIRTVLWKYLSVVWKEMQKNAPWLADYFDMSATRVFAKGYERTWFVFAKTARPGHEESLAGQHNRWYMVIADEASGISNKACGVITGALTDERNRMLMLSQPTRNTGYFYDSHHSLAKNEQNPKGFFTALRFNSEDSHWVHTSFLERKLKEYGGRESPEYQIKVLGIFPENLSGFLLSRSDMEKATQITLNHEENVGFLALADVALGTDRDSSVITIWKVSGFGMSKKLEEQEVVVMPGDMDPDDFGFYINEYLLGKQHLYPEITIGVDWYGPGFQTVKRLIGLGNFEVVALKWGAPCFSDNDKQRFKNKRAMANVYARDAIQQGRMKLLPHKRQMEEGAKLPYEFLETGQYKMMGKQEMMAKGIKSPDIFDTIAFTFLLEHTVVEMYETEEEGGGDHFEELAKTVDMAGMD